MAIEAPEIKQVGKGDRRRFQWKFSDGKWRDMLPTLTAELREATNDAYYDRTGSTTDIDDWSFLDLMAASDILPDYLKENTAQGYAAVLGNVWGEVTGNDPDKLSKHNDFQRGEWTKRWRDSPAGFNWDGREFTHENDYAAAMTAGDPNSVGTSWNEAAPQEIADLFTDMSEEAAAEYNWSALARDRGYTIDWSDPNAAYAFLDRAQDDLERGRIYTDHDNYRGIDLTEPQGPELPPGGTGGGDGDGRKVVGEYDNEAMANMAAGNIENSKVDERDGKFVVTVPPGQGGWGSKADAEAWLKETSGDSADNFEVAPGQQGNWFIREKADTGGKHSDKAAADKWIAETGGGDSNLESIPDGAGNWVVREKAKEQEKTYSTADTFDKAGNVIPGTPGDMFQPTVTEDPTGRKFGMTAGGDIKDFGYGMAGDITQEELAGYQVPSRSLEEIVAKAIEVGNWDLARGVQAFMDSPTERDLLDYAAQYAEAPADLAVLSAIARGEQMVQPGVPLPEGMGTGQSQATRIGAPGEVYTSAYKSFIDSMNQGYVPNEEELRQLFDPENDPAYIRTKELADKYETEIGTLRDQINEANKTASERIENNQTQTMNMMTGMFDSSMKSFKELMVANTNMKDDEIARLLENNKALRLGTGDTDSTSSGGAGDESSLGGSDSFNISAPGGESLANQIQVLQNEWMANNPGKDIRAMPGWEAAFDATQGGSQQKFLDWLTSLNSEELVTGGEQATGPAMVPSQTSFTNTGQALPIPEPIAQSFAQYQANPDKPSWDIATNAPGQTATESQFVYQTADKGWGGADETKPSWQQEYFAPQVKAEQESLALRPDQWEFEGAEGGVVQGPTVALLGEKEPEFIVPFSKVDDFKRGKLPIENPRQTRRGSTVANFTDSMPRFANGGLVTGPRFGGVTARGLEQYSGIADPSIPTPPDKNFTGRVNTGQLVTPETRAELDLGAEGRYGGDITRAPRIASSDFESLLTQYATPESQRYLREGTTALGQQSYRDEGTRDVQMGNIPEYELRHRLGASEFAGTNPAQHPIGIQQLMAGRPMARPRSLMTAANMPTPSGQALRNMLPSELAYYKKMGRMAGIPQEELDQEMRAAMPGGTRRTPLSMRARRVRQA